MKKFLWAWGIIFLLASGPAQAQKQEYEAAVKAMKEGRHADAAKIAGPWAEKGDADAQFIMAGLYYFGSGVEKNYPRAATEFARAATQGHRGAMEMLAMLYAEGKGVFQSLPHAHMWTTVVAALSEGERRKKQIQNMVNLETQMSEAQIQASRQLFVRCWESKLKECGWEKTAALMADKSRQHAVAEGFVEAAEAYNREDFATAYRLAKPLAEGGDAEAQNMLARLYSMGAGVAENPRAAFEWRQRAAAQNHAEARMFLARHYLIGEFVEKDVPRGIAMLEQSAKDGMADAAVMLAQNYHHGVISEKNLTKAMEWYRHAAELGHGEAQYFYGAGLMIGQGVAVQEQEGLRWLREAARKRLPQAWASLGVAYKTGMGVSVDLKRAATHFFVAFGLMDEEKEEHKKLHSDVVAFMAAIKPEISEKDWEESKTMAVACLSGQGRCSP